MADRNFLNATQDSRRILGGGIFTFSWCFDDVIKAFTIQDDSEKIFWLNLLVDFEAGAEPLRARCPRLFQGFVERSW